VTDFLIRGDLATLDPAIAELIQHEHARQFAKLIMIPSESTAPAAVLQAEGSVLQNLYAEGYPHPSMHGLTEEQLLAYDEQLAYFRRYADRRYYKGVEYCNILESLARRRGAELFCPPGLTPDQVYLSVQSLSGAVANTAVYEALVNEGDTVMGLDLLHGGHLSHGSPVNHSGRHHRMVFYRVDEKTERLDYDAIYETAMREKPKMIITGYTSYPWAPDLQKFREIADAVGAYLMADISHVVGLVIGGVYPNPVGVADVTTFTTHKTLMGPRGAVIVSTDEAIAHKIERAVFPGEQGGPHMNKIAGIAVAFKLAQQPEYKLLQRQIVSNAQALADGFKANGLRVVHDGTDTHLVLLDCKTISYGKEKLMGDAAARILDLANIVCNRNTIPGDRDATRPSALRFGTPWVTQRGLREPDMREIADVIALILKTAKPYTYISPHATAYRAKVDFDKLVEGAQRISALAHKAGVDADIPRDGYPHEWSSVTLPATTENDLVALEVRGEAARSFLQDALTSDISALEAEETQPAWVLERSGEPMSPAIVLNAGNTYRIAVPTAKATRVAQWFRALSDGYVLFDDKDIPAKLAGPVIVNVTSAAGFDASALPTQFSAQATGVATYKPYFIGQCGLKDLAAHTLPVSKPQPVAEEAHAPLKRTALYETHKQLGAKLVPFAGWEMPVWYGNSSVSEEHMAVRNAAGLFDVSHMGVLEFSGPNACDFLDAVSTNDVHDVHNGGSLYSYLLDADGDVIDDIMIYRVGQERYMVVVNASNDDKDQAWLRALNEGTSGAIKLPHCQMRDLRDTVAGADMRVDIALQGPASLKTLQALLGSAADRAALAKLERTDIMHATLCGLDVFISRTGYTGESVAYEIFVHPGQSATLWRAILDAGKAFGVRPAGLAARDSTRTEAGLPLYGHELAGPLNLAPYHIGFGGYVKSYKPFFIGKTAYYQKASQATTKLSRFRMNQKGVRVPKLGDPVLDARGRVIGTVTSCALDSEGYLLGLAMIETSFGAKDGVAVNVLAIPERMPAPLTSLAALGSRTLMPDAATVLTRFPKKK
jgi:glycine hydroxymethyltransferase